MLNGEFAADVKKLANKKLFYSEDKNVEKIGLLAGIGKLPVEIACAARKMGFSIVTVGLVEGVDARLAQVSDTFAQIQVGDLERIFAFLKENEVEKVTMIGKVTKELMFNGKVILDARMQKLLSSLPDNSDDTLMLAFVRELAAEGMTAFDQTALIRFLMPAPGVLTKREPTQAEKDDMQFGFKMAKAIGGLDIGQTVVVKDLAVMAVEAIEGTDECIKRGGQLGRGKVTVAKVAKPKQDNRFDVPAVGLDTLKSMCEAKAVALVIEAGKTLVVDREKVIQFADENGITILAM